MFAPRTPPARVAQGSVNEQGTSFDKATLPDLDWSYDALEPYISGEINKVS